MTPEQRKRFAELWNASVPLATIAVELGYSFQTLAKWRMSLGLAKRYVERCDLSDLDAPCPETIKLRCLEVQTAWTPEERARRWRGGR
jgi:hypothetical protein